VGGVHTRLEAKVVDIVAQARHQRADLVGDNERDRVAIRGDAAVAKPLREGVAVLLRRNAGLLQPEELSDEVRDSVDPAARRRGRACRAALRALRR
jgi:hypothetical protein